MADAARLAGCSVRTVRRAYTDGRLRASRRRGSRAIVLRFQDVLEWAAGEPLTADARALPHGARERARAARLRPARAVAAGGHGAAAFDISRKALDARRERIIAARPPALAHIPGLL